MFVIADEHAEFEDTSNIDIEDIEDTLKDANAEMREQCARYGWHDVPQMYLIMDELRCNGLTKRAIRQEMSMHANNLADRLKSPGTIPIVICRTTIRNENGKDNGIFNVLRLIPERCVDVGIVFPSSCDDNDDKERISDVNTLVKSDINTLVIRDRGFYHDLAIESEFNTVMLVISITISERVLEESDDLRSMSQLHERYEWHSASHPRADVHWLVTAR